MLNTEVTALITTQVFKKPDTGSIDNLYYLSMSSSASLLRAAADR